MLLDQVSWHSYYSKQQDDFKIKSNDKYEYAFSALANSGLLHSYQVDIWGNEFGLFKGYQREELEDGSIRITISDKAIHSLIEKEEDLNLDDSDKTAILLNGGYFESPDPDKIRRTV